ncbi:hypothetical protein GCM10027570_39560 [Streptomonospora sediminis]
MSTIFGHGRLRLYLLKLLDESPRHGYEIISLLRDRFLGVYSPSPGTIYPRLARLEEEGLVTHEEVDGRKVYRLTDRGREELHSRSADLDDLERQLTDSVRDVAEAVREDVRHTISSLREELKFGGTERRARNEEARARAAGTAKGAGTGTGAGTGAAKGTGDEAGAGTAAGTGTSDTAAGTAESDRDRSGAEGEDASGGGPWWGRDWERFAQGFGVWGKRAGGGAGGADRPEFDQALRDFSDRVRDVVREAGHVGESAAHDLRRILDDAFETIRRDVGGWGPRDTEQDADRGEHTGDGGKHKATTGTAGTAGSGTQAEQGGQSGPDAGEPTAAGSADPWSAATSEQQDGKAAGSGAGPDGHGAESAGPAGPTGSTGSTGSTSTADSADPWSTAINEDTDNRGGGPAR